MPASIRITVGDAVLNSELNDSKTARMVWNALPLECEFNTWGDEIYFAIPVETGPEDPQATVQVGDLGYWPPGHAFCIFYGRTPASTDERPRAASPVNIIGTVSGDATVFRAVSSGTRVRLERV